MPKKQKKRYITYYLYILYFLIKLKYPRQLANRSLSGVYVRLHPQQPGPLLLPWLLPSLLLMLLEHLWEGIMK